MRWRRGNAWSGPLSVSMRSEKGAEDHLKSAVKERCRAEGHATYHFATFSDIQQDETPKAAWEHFGGGAQQSTFARKTSFKLVFFSNTHVPTDRISSSSKWQTCWTAKQLKAEERRQKLERKRAERAKRAVEEAKKKNEN